jgi:predicted ArsR family transcriptional regulator
MTATVHRGRGRPRPTETIDRDQQTLELLSRGPLTRKELADRLGVNLNLAYLTLDRLRELGRVRRTTGGRGDGRTYTWELVD